VGASAPRPAPAGMSVQSAPPARSESARGESGGQRWSCCHDNPGGRGPRASGQLVGGRRRGGRGRPLSLASARPRVPCRVPGGGGGRCPPSSPCAPSLRRAALRGWRARAGLAASRPPDCGRTSPTGGPGCASCGSPLGTFYRLWGQMRDLGRVYKSTRTYV
jgi:hypothetical protein